MVGPCGLGRAMHGDAKERGMGSGEWGREVQRTEKEVQRTGNSELTE